MGGSNTTDEKLQTKCTSNMKFIHLNNLNRLIRWYWYNMKFNYTSIICSYLLLFLNLTNQKKSNLKHSYIFLYFRKRNPPTPPLPPPKKNLVFHETAALNTFLYFKKSKHLSSSSKKKKSILSKMFLNFFIFKKIKVSGSNIKKVVIFSQKGAFLIFKETETLKKLFAFQKCELSYILGNGNLKKLLLFQEVTFQARKMRKTHFEKSFYISGNETF